MVEKLPAAKIEKKTNDMGRKVNYEPIVLLESHHKRNLVQRRTQYLPH